jgi:hypothetical protein
LSSAARVVFAECAVTSAQLSEFIKPQRHGQNTDHRITHFFEECPLPQIFTVDNPMGKKNAPRTSTAPTATP